MKVLLVTFGSRGDVHPMLGLGQALLRRGHAVELLTNPFFADETRRAGLDFTPIGSEDDYRQTLAHPKLWHPIDGLGVMWRYLLRPALRPTYEALRQRAAPDASGAPAPLVLASPLAMGARVAQESLGIRLVTAHTAATSLRSVHDPLTIAQWRVPRAVPRWARRGLWGMLDRAKLDPLVKPALEALRSEAGLAPLSATGSAVFDRWLHAPLGGLTLFPHWFAATPSDWPAPVHRGGFVVYDEPPAQQGSAPWLADLERFLQAGPAPVVFMPGTAQQRTDHFFRAAAAACLKTGHRGILLGHRERGTSPDASTLPGTLWSAPYVPFADLLPRARAIVHHGGIGTCAQALRAGIPQLVWPQAYDQFDNALRLEHLGVGQTLAHGPLDAERLAGCLSALLARPQVAQACKHWAKQLKNEGALDASCAWLESLP